MVHLLIVYMSGPKKKKKKPFDSYQLDHQNVGLIKTLKMYKLRFLHKY